MTPAPSSVIPSLWLSPRGVWLLFGVGVLFAAGAWAAPVLPVALGAAALLGGLLLADAGLGPDGRRLRFVREPVERLALRRTATVRYRVENRAASSIRIGLVEPPVASVRFERELVVARVRARGAALVEQQILPLERGPAAFGRLYAWVENSIGLLRRRYVAGTPEVIRVFPDLSGIEEYGSLARRSTLVDAGLRKLRARGVGTDFESVREYGPGDDFRRIEWKATARRGRLMVAQHEVERSQTVLIALDCGRFMTPRVGVMRKFDYALTAALSAARIAEAADDHVGLVAFAGKPLLEIAPRRGKAHVAALASAAYDLQPRLEEPDYERTMARLKAEHGKRSLVILFTDMFDPAASATVLGSLRILVPRHVVMCVLMNDEAIASALAREPSTPRDAFRASVAMRLLDERIAALSQLRSLGIIVVDAAAARLTVALLDAYLDVKARRLL